MVFLPFQLWSTWFDVRGQQIWPAYLLGIVTFNAENEDNPRSAFGRRVRGSRRAETPHKAPAIYNLTSDNIDR